MPKFTQLLPPQNWHFCKGLCPLVCTLKKVTIPSLWRAGLQKDMLYTNKDREKDLCLLTRLLIDWTSPWWCGWWRWIKGGVIHRLRRCSLVHTLLLLLSSWWWAWVSWESKKIGSVQKKTKIIPSAIMRKQLNPKALDTHFTQTC